METVPSQAQSDREGPQRVFEVAEFHHRWDGAHVRGPLALRHVDVTCPVGGPDAGLVVHRLLERHRHRAIEAASPLPLQL